MFNNAMMKQAKKMQEKMKVAQEEIAKMETEGSSGGIKVKLIGGKTVEEVEVSDKLFEQGDKSLLEKFIKDAINDATNKEIIKNQREYLEEYFIYSSTNSFDPFIFQFAM